MSGPPLISVDFSGRRRRQTVAGVILLAVGVLATTTAFLGYRQLEASRAGLELKYAEASRRNQRDPAQQRRNAALNEEGTHIAQELGKSWTPLLAELEAASHDSAGDIALLSVEPDDAKHLVRVSGESRDLTRVLAYLGRLQSSVLLRHPMLESHEVRSDDPQHPVRFALSAEWRR